MRHRVIMEAILEAHQNVDNYGETWYVLNDDWFSVVKESYFIEDNGTRKDKPFVSLYNTTDCIYGSLGMAKKMEYKDGKVSCVAVDIETQFEQPYSTKIEKERGINVVLIGEKGHGRSVVLQQALQEKQPIIGLHDAKTAPKNPFSTENVMYITNPYKNLPKLIDSTEGKKDNSLTKQETDAKRRKSRLNRKKKGKKTHRK